MSCLRLPIGFAVLLLAGLLACPDSATAQSGGWVKLEGQIVWKKGVAVPERQPLNVTQDKGHCLEKGPILAEEIVVNAKNGGLKSVWVYLRPDSTDKAAKLDPKKDIKPELVKVAPKTFEVDQPSCMFVPRIFAIREGDFIDFKNSSPVAHNTKLDADAPSPSYNKTIAPKGNYKDPAPFVAQRSPITISCSMHPWMNGQFMVFDHPYFAVTDADGKFTIPDCPAGKYRLVYRHELGFHKGRDGALGWPVEIKAGPDGVMKLEPLEFEMPEKK